MPRIANMKMNRNTVSDMYVMFATTSMTVVNNTRRLRMCFASFSNRRTRNDRNTDTTPLEPPATPGNRD